MTAIGVFIADAALMLAGGILAACNIQSWLVALPLLLVNLPTLPIACLFSSVFEGRSELNEWVGIVRGVAMFLFEAIFSSIAWGWIAAHVRGRPPVKS